MWHHIAAAQTHEQECEASKSEVRYLQQQSRGNNFWNITAVRKFVFKNNCW
jgi:hypothetical protein